MHYYLYYFKVRVFNGCKLPRKLEFRNDIISLGVTRRELLNTALSIAGRAIASIYNIRHIEPGIK